MKALCHLEALVSYFVIHAVEEIYSAICECQLLYPDPDLSDSSGEEEDIDNIQEISECPSDFFTSAEGLEHLTAEGEVVLAHLESILHIDAEIASENGQSNYTLCKLTVPPGRGIERSPLLCVWLSWLHYRPVHNNIIDSTFT